MTKILRISNQGKVQKEAFSLIGASTKRGSTSKIGMFGSGNKYALAYLMRNNLKFKIYSGHQEIIFGRKEVVLQDYQKQDFAFDLITINEKETSITTEMGHHWGLWQAIRELYSNAVDEGLTFFGTLGRKLHMEELEPGDTHVLIEVNDELREFLANVGDYFAQDRKILWQNGQGKIYQKQSNQAGIFRKGIKCFDTKLPSIFDYDFDRIEISEDRVVQYSWSLPQTMWEILYQCTEPMIIRKLLETINERDWLERKLDDSFVTTYSEKLSDAWGDALEGHQICPRSLAGYLEDEDRPKTFILPGRLYQDLVVRFGKRHKSKSFQETSKGQLFTLAPGTALMSAMLKDVMDFFDQCNFEIPYSLDVVKFTDENIHGSADFEGKTILIDADAFDKGKEWIASIILEEYIHLKHNVADETRAFQNASIQELIKYMKISNSFNL